MARRKAVADGSGVLGPFDRTPKVWAGLGGPPSLWDATAAALAWRRCAMPGYRYDFADPFAGLRDDPGRRLSVAELSASANTLAFTAARWWQAARPVFLARLDALTREESSRMQRLPVYYQLRPDVFDLGEVELELFGRSESDRPGEDRRLT